MAKTDLYFKVEVVHHPDEPVERIISEIERQMRKVYVVHAVEFQNSINVSNEPLE